MEDAESAVRIGTAGWVLPRAVADRFPGEGAHLARYARVLPACEINSSFHRPHRPSTYARWAASVPASFRFSVKLPRTITHGRRLVDAAAELDTFLGEARGLDTKLGCLLVQLPPSLAFAPAEAANFFAALRERYGGDTALEPRHASWFDGEADEVLVRYRLARVAADPARVPKAATPGGWRGLAYWRLHGSPRVYYSAYADTALDALAASILAARRRASRIWCIFDNTTSGAATANALDLMARLGVGAHAQ